MLISNLYYSLKRRMQLSSFQLIIFNLCENILSSEKNYKTYHTFQPSKYNNKHKFREKLQNYHDFIGLRHIINFKRHQNLLICYSIYLYIIGVYNFMLSSIFQM